VELVGEVESDDPGVDENQISGEDDQKAVVGGRNSAMLSRSSPVRGIAANTPNSSAARAGNSQRGSRFDVVAPGSPAPFQCVTTSAGSDGAAVRVPMPDDTTKPAASPNR
jgi:hypothetical protein